MYWGWKSRQEPDGPAFERNPSELPKTHFVEKGREHSSWYSFWGPEHECGIGRDILVTSHWLPGVGQDEPIIQVVEYTNALKPEKGQSSIHALCERPRCQRQEPCIGNPSLQKRTEGTCCAPELPEYENRHLSDRQWQTSLPLESAVPLWHKKIVPEKALFQVWLRDFLYCPVESSSCCSTEAFEALLTTVRWTPSKQGGLQPKWSV